VRLVELAQRAEAAGFDLIAFDDSFDPVEPGLLPFRVDALLALARIAPTTDHIGLLATVTTTHTEPFHVSKNVATLDLVSGGRAAWRVRPSTSDAAAASFGRKPAEGVEVLSREAAETIEVVRRLWDSWEDDAVIRDRDTGRYIDRTKVHYVDFEGEFFSVRGPSITPRSPQGQPIVAIDLDQHLDPWVAAVHADLVIVHPESPDAAVELRSTLERSIIGAGRTPNDVTVLLEARIGEQAQRRELDRLDASLRADHRVDIVGDATAVVDELVEWSRSGAVDGFVLAPDLVDGTLDWLATEVIPPFRAVTGSARRPGSTLRARLGLERPPSRYASTGVGP
jgi:alkanesulfonate monooxygenase SsuD/methylene tetrahydromethanopterin reductase-like flavin-dependent oxidoreductase (luciferase family)